MIGRASGCDVRVNHPTVSRLHAELYWSEGTLVIVHLSTVNPTLVNGVPVSEPCPLRTGDLIEISDGAALRLELFASGDDCPTEIHRYDLRRMYAVLYADVAGYSRLVEENDVATARQLEDSLATIKAKTELANGRIIRVAGDGLLVVFTSTVSAVMSAIGWQQSIARANLAVEPARRMEFRVGINAGDILITPDGSMHGDAINIAARLQALAAPGGILVSGVVYDQLQGQAHLRFEQLGINELKNISRDVRIYRLEF